MLSSQQQPGTLTPTMFESGSVVGITGDHPIFAQGQVVNTNTGNHTHHYYNSEGGRRAFDLLTKNVATGALHTSSELLDASKCHPGTREAILDSILSWAAAMSYIFSIQWLHGPAGSGKSAILRTLAEMFEKRGLLLATFFFFRAAAGRNTADHIIPTIAYQICRTIPNTRRYVEEAIDQDPLIFTQSLEVQVHALVVLPLIRAHREGNIPSACPRVIVIDGLDECKDESRQCEILRVLSSVLRKLPFPIAILVASRPEPHIQHAFDIGELNQVSSRLALDESYEPDKDIRKYYQDKFCDIRCHHPLRSSFLDPWPSASTIDLLVKKASGQFIFSSTIIKFVEPHRHDPSQRLNMVIGTISPGKLKPFEQLDALYSTIFATIDVDDLDALLRLLGVLLIPHAGNHFIKNFHVISSLGRLTGFTPVEIKRLLFDLTSLLAIKGQFRAEGDPESPSTFKEEGQSSPMDNEEIHVHHASLADFLFDRHRSNIFFIDIAMISRWLSERCIDLLSSTTDEIVIQYIKYNLKPNLQQANFSSHELTTLLAVFNPIKVSQFKMAPFDYLEISCILTDWLHSLPNPEIKSICSAIVRAQRGYVQRKLEVYFKRKLTPLLVLALEGFNDVTFHTHLDVIAACLQHFFPVWSKGFAEIQESARPDVEDGFSLSTSLVAIISRNQRHTILLQSISSPGFRDLILECIGSRLGDCYGDFSLHILNWLVLYPSAQDFIHHLNDSKSTVSSEAPFPFLPDDPTDIYSGCMTAAASILPFLLPKSAPHPEIIRILKHHFTPTTHPDFTTHDKVQEYLLKWNSSPTYQVQSPSPGYPISAPFGFQDDDVTDATTMTQETPASQNEIVVDSPKAVTKKTSGRADQRLVPTFREVFTQAWGEKGSNV